MADEFIQVKLRIETVEALNRMSPRLLPLLRQREWFSTRGKAGGQPSPNDVIRFLIEFRDQETGRKDAYARARKEAAKARRLKPLEIQTWEDDGGLPST